MVIKMIQESFCHSQRLSGVSLSLTAEQPQVQPLGVGKDKLPQQVISERASDGNAPAQVSKAAADAQLRGEMLPETPLGKEGQAECAGSQQERCLLLLRLTKLF